MTSRTKTFSSGWCSTYNGCSSCNDIGSGTNTLFSNHNSNTATLPRLNFTDTVVTVHAVTKSTQTAGQNFVKTTEQLFIFIDLSLFNHILCTKETLMGHQKRHGRQLKYLPSYFYNPQQTNTKSISNMVYLCRI